MALIEWCDSYSIGIKSVDEQHQQLVSLINRLNTAIADGECSSVVADILEGLTQYTRIHFAYEEKLFDLHGYPDSDAHKNKHEKLLARVEQFKQDFSYDPTSALSLELMQFLTQWLTGHIQGSDKEYAPFLLDKGIS